MINWPPEGSELRKWSQVVGMHNLVSHGKLERAMVYMRWPPLGGSSCWWDSRGRCRSQVLLVSACADILYLGCIWIARARKGWCCRGQQRWFPAGPCSRCCAPDSVEMYIQDKHTSTATGQYGRLKPWFYFNKHDIGYQVLGSRRNKSGCLQIRAPRRLSTWRNLSLNQEKRIHQLQEKLSAENVSQETCFVVSILCQKCNVNIDPIYKRCKSSVKRNTLPS